MATRYRIKSLVDTDFDVEGFCEFAEDRQAHYDYGTFGFVVEALIPGKGKCATCGHVDNDHWEHVDSCWGFAGNDGDYMLEQALICIPEGAGDIPVLDDHDNVINTHRK